MPKLHDPVPLGRVFLRKDGWNPDESSQILSAMERIERAFEAAEIIVFGRRSSGSKRKPISRADYEIEWFGKATVTDDYCSVCAIRRGLSNSVGISSLALFRDTFEDLAISREDWDKLFAPAPVLPVEPAGPVSPAPPERRGRKPGVPVYDDGAALEEMKRVLASGEATSNLQAAKLAAHLTKGLSLDATIKRLRGKYSKAAPSPRCILIALK